MRNAWVITTALLLGSGCVFPNDEPTGIEFSWRFVESNELDGVEAQRVRNCDGALVNNVAFDILDTEAPERGGRFRFACNDGFQTANEAATQASDAFLALRSGNYELDVMVGVDAGDELLVSRVVDVLSRESTIEAFELRRAPVDITFMIASGDSCADLSLAMRYADAERDIPDAPRDDDGEVQPLLYRETLVTDRGLGLSGQPAVCSTDLDGAHVVPAVDLGSYTLDVTVNAVPCAVSVVVDAASASAALPIDLANLPCAG